MNVELNNIQFNVNKIENNKILLVKVIQRLDNGEIVIDINGEKVKTKVDREIPDSFFAYVEKKVENHNIKIILRIIESFKNLNESISDKSQLEIIKDFILLNSLPLIEDNISVAIEMLKNKIPLTVANFELIKYSLRKYGEISFLISEILQAGKKIDKNFIDILFNIKEIIQKVFDDRSNIDVINNFILLVNYLSDSKHSFHLRFEEDEYAVITAIEKDGDKKRYYFDFSSENIKNFLVVVDVSKAELLVKVYLEKDILDENSKKLESGKLIFIDKLKKIYPEKKINFNFLEYKNNIFENKFSSENKNNIGNLDIII
ncbi:MAG: hypothetical protein ACP5Q5_05890 [Brevinematia bacterium]